MKNIYLSKLSAFKEIYAKNRNLEKEKYNNHAEHLEAWENEGDERKFCKKILRALRKSLE